MEKPKNVIPFHIIRKKSLRPQKNIFRNLKH